MFKVIRGIEISNYLDQETESVLKIVQETYLMHKMVLQTIQIVTS